MLGASHNEAVSALREAGNCIQLLVCDGWNTPTSPPPEPPQQETQNHDSTDAFQKHPNGEVTSSNLVAPESSVDVERPPSANQEKVCEQPRLHKLIQHLLKLNKF